MGSSTKLLAKVYNNIPAVQFSAKEKATVHNFLRNVMKICQ